MKRLLTSELATTLVGVSADSVLGIADTSRGGYLGNVIDVAAALGLSPSEAAKRPTEGLSRKVLVVGTRQGLRRLLVGDRARIIDVEDEDIHELPRFLAGERLRSFQGVFIVGSRVGFLLDAAAFGAAGKRTPAP